jgi:hypothetical protein
VAATFLIESDDPEHEICYGLAVLFNFDEAVQINPTLTISKSTPLKPPSQIQSNLSVCDLLSKQEEFSNRLNLHRKPWTTFLPTHCHTVSP